jgi:methyl-accepting chemotaxis protein
MSALRNRLVWKLSAVILAVLLLLSFTLVYMQIQNIGKASEEAIGNFSLHNVSAYAGKFDTEKYEEYTKNAQENDLYWSIREEMNRYREQIGALYVYTVKFDDQKNPIILIDGQPKGSESASPIGEVTDMPQYAIDLILKGESAKSSIIHNPEYGDYISSYAPLRDASGNVIGALGLDMDVSVYDAINRQIMGQSIPVFVLMGILALMVYVLIVWFLSRSLRPLGIIVKGAEATASGDVAEAKRILSDARIRSNDEIGRAYYAMAQMVEKLGVTLKEVVSDMESTAHNLVDSVNQFNSETSEMLDMNVKLEEAVTQLAQGAQQQRLGTEEGARSMNEINLAITRVSEASANMSILSGEAMEQAEQGQDSIRRLKHQVESIYDMTMQTSITMDTLNGRMNEIDPVLHLVADVAEQTKLLALNAAIEAARAGEQGSGFAVVAAEVRKLADTSAVSTQRITSLLKQIRQDTAQITKGMKEGSQGVGIGTELSSQAELLFNRTMERFVHVNSQIQEISAASEEVLASSEEVTVSMEQISDISGVVAENTLLVQNMSAFQLEAAKRIAETTELLKRRSASLEAAVSKFTL